MRNWGFLLGIALAVGCVKRLPPLVDKSALGSVRTVALVQVVEFQDGRLALGATLDSSARQLSLEESWDAFVANFSKRWKVMSRAEVLGNAKYLALGQDKADGPCWIPGGFRVLKGSDSAWAKLDPKAAAAAAAALEVDAVIALSETFSLGVADRGGFSRNRYLIAMYDRDGARIWSDDVTASDALQEGLTVVYGRQWTSLADSPQKWVLHNANAFKGAMREMTTNLAMPPDEYLTVKVVPAAQ